VVADSGAVMNHGSHRVYENEPALESDLDVVVGSADARKDRLDTIFKTALVLKF
jgi:hypothetical protein